jgi:hypothetical protein
MGYRSVLQIYQAAPQLYTSAKQNRKCYQSSEVCNHDSGHFTCSIKKQKKLSGFKIPKRKFAQELENDVLYNFVILCKGVAEVAKKLIDHNSS